jgi:hypothetical protein
VVTGGATTLTGVLATDFVTGVSKPTLQAAATNAAIPYSAVPTADTMTLSFFGVGTGYTPTASEVYGIRTARIAPAAPLLLYSQSLAPVSVAARPARSRPSPSPASSPASPVWVNKPSQQAGLAISGVRVSAAEHARDQLLQLHRLGDRADDRDLHDRQLPVPTPGNGNVVYQAVGPGAHGATSTLANAIRSALVSLGLIAGL